MTPAARELARLQLLVATLYRHGAMRVEDLASRLSMTRGEVLAAVDRLQLVHGGDDSPAGYVDIDVDATGMVEMTPGLDQGLGRRPLPLTQGEYTALCAAVRAAAAGPLAALATEADAVLARLEQAQSPAVRDRVRRHRERVAIGADNRPADPVWRTVRACLERGEEVELEYLAASSDEVTRRTVRPIEVVGRNGFWYLVAWCGLRGAERPFRLDRVVSARPTGRRFARGPARTRDVGAPPGSRMATVRFDRDLAGWVRERHPPERVRDLADGSVEVRVPFASAVWIAGFVVSHAGRAVVVDPPDLRDEVRRRLLAAFGAPEGDGGTP